MVFNRYPIESSLSWSINPSAFDGQRVKEQFILFHEKKNSKQIIVLQTCRSAKQTVKATWTSNVHRGTWSFQTGKLAPSADSYIGDLHFFSIVYARDCRFALGHDMVVMDVVGE